MSTPETITIYGAGGCGINLAAQFQDIEQTQGFAKVNTVYCDASRSNISAGISDDQCFIIPELDGSGKVRNENAAEIGSHIGKVLESHKPSKFNVVIFSASGGTGSVFGPLIARELAKRRIPMVLIVVGDNESYTSARNTLKTYKTLESIYKSSEAPLIISWHKNCSETPRYSVDERIHTIVDQLSLLASGLNRELDSRDIANWIYFNKPVESLKPQLALLDITNDPAVAQQIRNPISVVNLLRAADSPAKDLKPEYSCSGYMPEMREGKGPDQGLVFVISIGGIEDVAQDILNDYEGYSDLSKTRAVVNETLLGSDDEVTEDGLVL